jgi:hypothetical protein
MFIFEHRIIFSNPILLYNEFYFEKNIGQFKEKKLEICFFRNAALHSFVFHQCSRLS